MRADTHDGPEHKRLKSKAGYIDARPHIRQLDESSLATHGRTIHWGQIRSFGDVGSISTLPPKADVDQRSCYVAQVPEAAILMRSLDRFTAP
jgi:hypothetical protein